MRVTHATSHPGAWRVSLGAGTSSPSCRRRPWQARMPAEISERYITSVDPNQDKEDPRQRWRSEVGKRCFTRTMFNDATAMLDLRFSQPHGYARKLFDTLKLDEDAVVASLILAARCANGGMPLSGHPDLLLVAICIIGCKLTDDIPVSVADASKALNLRQRHVEAAEIYVFDWLLKFSSFFISRSEYDHSMNALWERASETTKRPIQGVQRPRSKSATTVAIDADMEIDSSDVRVKKQLRSRSHSHEL